MLRSPPVGSNDYYDTLPGSAHQPGDIWVGLPSYGYLGSRTVTGMVITPACDLSKRKVETVTFLPIIPVSCYFGTVALLPEVLRELSKQLDVVGISAAVPEPRERFFPPTPDAIAALEKSLMNAEATAKNGQSQAAIAKAISGVALLRNIAAPELSCPPKGCLAGLFSQKPIQQIMDKVVTNAYRSDIHFLPADGQRRAWAGVSEHSVVLFRYVCSAPAELFEAAQDLDARDWTAELFRISQTFPGAAVFSDERPMKRSTLRPRFVADLITRFSAVHLRLGSPDFTAETVAEYSQSLQNSV